MSILKVRLFPGVGKEATLKLAPEVLNALGLKVGDFVRLDISHTGHELIVYKDGSKGAPTMKGVKEVIKS